jgi:hypothetical protein
MPKVRLAGRKVPWVLLAVCSAAVLLAPGLAHADMIVPLSPVTLHATGVIILVEAVALALFVRRTLKARPRILILLLTSSVANLLSSMIGVIFYFTPGFVMTLDFSSLGLVALAFAFVLSTFVEWPVYIVLCRGPHFTKRRLLRASLVANSVSYLMLLGFLIGVSIKDAIQM